MHGQDLDAGNPLDHRLHDWPGRFCQFGPHLFEQVLSLLGRELFDQVLFGWHQDASQANQ